MSSSIFLQELKDVVLEGLVYVGLVLGKEERNEEECVFEALEEKRVFLLK